MTVLHKVTRRSSWTARTSSPPMDHVPQGGAEGMIVTSGGPLRRLRFYLLKGKPRPAVEHGRPRTLKWEGRRRDCRRPPHGRVRFPNTTVSAPARSTFNNFSGLGLRDRRVERWSSVDTKTMPRVPDVADESCSGTRASMWVPNRLTGVNDADYRAIHHATLNKLTLTVDRPQLRRPTSSRCKPLPPSAGHGAPGRAALTRTANRGSLSLRTRDGPDRARTF